MHAYMAIGSALNSCRRQLCGIVSEVQCQIRAIRGLRDASRSRSGSLAFEDVDAFIAMLRETVAQQKERIAEAARYDHSHIITNYEDEAYLPASLPEQSRRVETWL